MLRRNYKSQPVFEYRICLEFRRYLHLHTFGITSNFSLGFLLGAFSLAWSRITRDKGI